MHSPARVIRNLMLVLVFGTVLSVAATGIAFAAQNLHDHKDIPLSIGGIVIALALGIGIFPSTFK